VRRTLFAILLAGCGFHAGEGIDAGGSPPLGDGGLEASGSDATGSDATGSDAAGSDATVIDANPNWCVGHWMQVCQPTAPTTPITLTGTVFTDTDSRCTSNAAEPGACTMVGTTVMVTGDTTVAGTKPLIIAASGAVTIDHALFVGSTHANIFPGAGADPTSCTVPTFDFTNHEGGVGGSFASIGGKGGACEVGSGPQEPTVSPLPTTLRGGCGGGQGGPELGQGTAGYGGGAIYIAASADIHVNGGGAVNAGGAGGSGGDGGIGGYSGGGGGGAGGMIVLDASTGNHHVQVDGHVAANGGAGGSGGSEGIGSPNGQTGEDAHADDMPAMGGIVNDSHGGNGATASAATDGVLGTSANTYGGGGGGGGAGYIHFEGTVMVNGGAVVSPPAQ
jgi:hypothetical protein